MSFRTAPSDVFSRLMAIVATIVKSDASQPASIAEIAGARVPPRPGTQSHTFVCVLCFPGSVACDAAAEAAEATIFLCPVCKLCFCRVETQASLVCAKVYDYELFSIMRAPPKKEEKLCMYFKCCACVPQLHLNNNVHFALTE